MSSQPIGLATIPKLLPVTGTFALPFTAYYALLSLRTVRERLQKEHYLGDNSSTGSADWRAYQNDKLYLLTRAHTNFTENVPLAFILATLVEVNGGNRKVLSWFLGSFLAMRVLHADFGILQQGLGSGRPIGYFGSVGLLSAIAGYGAFLVKGYWGF
ncbi:hypothetical protein COL26b_009881 [Colletotrichum chrysophilum]|uniref:uncharacterized protein n=1 Tax=Colletotrichum chrysophilum TaxID=1836956 RepID=UPI002301D94C|nr:uncharacterized protein COL26b_009881 [Colletotrichum chrysophilum]KAJ0370990.1 hypothetical protein COL26b_009881 [Colletotrichum chrysophilum]